MRVNCAGSMICHKGDASLPAHRLSRVSSLLLSAFRLLPIGDRRRSAVLILLATLGLIPARALVPVAGRHGMVVSSEQHASETGVEILKAGGNAVDAAVAVGFALAVTHPYAGNIGGGGFMLIRMATGNAVMVDYREQAPGAATHNMYLDAGGNVIPGASIEGALAVGVPGTVAGLALAERKYGKLGLERVMQPAIRLAEDGFEVSYFFSQSMIQNKGLLSKFAESNRIFLRDGRYYMPGEIFKQPSLGRTLRAIAWRGPDAFYQGEIARQTAATIAKYHGILMTADMASYQAKLRPPLVGHFRGFTILTDPPPSSGGVGLLEMLNILDPLDLGQPDSFHSMFLMTEAMRRAYADRAAYLGDADFVEVPVGRLVSPEYAGRLREQILESKPDSPVRAGLAAESGEREETTHFSVVDADGNAVSNTYTLNGAYGSGITVEGAGFLLNDEMDDFASRPGEPNMFGLIQSEANSIAPHKRPLSSMTPTIVLEDGAGQPVRLVLGSPGGGTIINTVLQVVLDVIAFHLDVRQAVTEPRFHHQWMPDKLFLENWGFSADTVAALKTAGYQVDIRPSFGECEAVEVDAKTEWRFGAADPRGDGRAVGY